MARKSRDQSAAVAEIGPLPKVKNPKRRKACERDLHQFLTTYFPHSTGLKPFSPDHRRVIERIQRCALEGGRFLQAVYRGFAKSTIAENTAIWATAYGHRSYVVIFGADKGAADDQIESIRLELETNDLLYEDFPEMCHPIRELEGKPQRCKSQACDGERTHIEFKAGRIVLADVKVPKGWMPRVKAGSRAPCAGAILRTKGLMGGSRGLKHKRPDGAAVRPDFVILDDFQTDQSAGSPPQSAKRLGVIKKSVVKLAGHNKALAIVGNATVIAKWDAVDQILTLPEYAAWQTERIPLVRKWADAHEAMWLGTYKDLRTTYDRDDPESQTRAHAAANAFYRTHRKEMDAGCEVSWEHCYDSETERSAIQHAYNALIDDGEEAFMSEFQQQPLDVQLGSGAMTVEMVRSKATGRAWRTVPAATKWLTAHVDVHDDLLYYAVAAITPDATPAVIDYGVWPRQSRSYFTVRDAKPTLREWCQQTARQRRQQPPTSKEAVIQAGLVALGQSLLTAEYPRDDGAEASIDRLGIDIGYVEDTVMEAIRAIGAGPRVMPVRGVGITASGKPLIEWRLPAKDKGDHWIWTVEQGRRYRVVKVDANAWKSRLRNAVVAAAGDAGSLTLPGKPEEHLLLGEHLAAEYPTETEGRGRKLEEWSLRPGVDNHHLDNLVNCLVLGSVLGAVLPGTGGSRPAPRPRLRMSELRNQKRGGRNAAR